jgi:hypothetical protein
MALFQFADPICGVGIWLGMPHLQESIGRGELEPPRLLALANLEGFSYLFTNTLRRTSLFNLRALDGIAQVSRPTGGFQRLLSSYP